MFLSTHTPVALLIVAKITNPILAIFLSLISHFVLDAIPHGDELIADHKKTHRERMFFYLRVMVIDVIIASSLVLLFIWQRPDISWWWIAVVVIVAWAPDFIWGAIEFFNIKFLYPIVKFHHRIHNLIGWHYPVIYGLPFQGIFIIAMTLLVLSL